MIILIKPVEVVSLNFWNNFCVGYFQKKTLCHYHQKQIIDYIHIQLEMFLTGKISWFLAVRPRTKCPQIDPIRIWYYTPMES